MDQINDISKHLLKPNFKRSLTKKRTTFWQMMKCILKLQYRPSLLLVLTIIGAGVYIFSPLSLLSEHPLYIRYLDDLFILIVLLKVLSHETHRYTRHKAKNRRFCD
jgi:uncharacterized membrane protein YkvA (DUF1232 family)